MKVGIPKETRVGERRVAATPKSVERLRKMGFEVVVEHDAGAGAEYADATYIEAGARIAEEPAAVWGCDVVLKVNAPGDLGAGQHEADLLREGALLISFIWPAQNKELVDRLAARKVSVLAMDCVPRITRAQRMDALSAMANIAGYRAVIEAAQHFPRFFAGQVTAAGKIEPARVLVIGAGVAGLAAIGAARGLGAVVRAFDTRPEVKDQVRSMGAEFVEMDFEEEGAGEGGYAKQMSEAFIKAEIELLTAESIKSDIVITTALIPGRPAPQLIPAGAVEAMSAGSVIVDLAAEQGGNCALTEPGKVAQHKGVTIIGYSDLPSRMARQSSELYATNLVHMLDELGGAESFALDEGNDILRGSMVLHDGELKWPPPRIADPSPPAKKEPAPPPVARPKIEARKPSKALRYALLALAAVAMIGIGVGAPESFLSHFTVFVLAIFVGWQVVWNVTPALHTPLMSVTNAISGIIVIGGMLHLGGQLVDGEIVFGWATALGVIAVLVASINIAGGFLVTRRMLAMFRK
ncbi:MAG: Re/Si-specific NAD(P)(+) transhydrogenase subunit alpha [Phycisphaerales bacterium JB039]